MIIVDRDGKGINNTPPLEVVRLARAAELMDISRATLDRIIARGELVTIGSGHLRRVALDDIRQWQEERRGKAEAT